MLINEELKKKIIETLEKGGRNFLKSKETKVSIYEYYAEALIAAELRFGENFTATFDRMALEREHELERRLAKAAHRAEVAERALRNAATRLKCRGGLGKGFCKVDKCDYYHCNNDDGCVKAHLDQAEKELAEERKDD